MRRPLPSCQHCSGGSPVVFFMTSQSDVVQAVWAYTRCRIAADGRPFNSCSLIKLPTIGMEKLQILLFLFSGTLASNFSQSCFNNPVSVFRIQRSCAVNLKIG